MLASDKYNFFIDYFLFAPDKMLMKLISKRVNNTCLMQILLMRMIKTWYFLLRRSVVEWRVELNNRSKENKYENYIYFSKWSVQNAYSLIEDQIIMYGIL